MKRKTMADKMAEASGAYTVRMYNRYISRTEIFEAGFRAGVAAVRADKRRKK